MKAIGLNILVRRVDEEVTSKGGFIISDLTDNDIRYKLAEVVSAGSDVKDLKPGDSVYYDSAAGSSIRVHGEKLVVVNERNIVVRL